MLLLVVFFSVAEMEKKAMMITMMARQTKWLKALEKILVACA